MHRRQNRDRLFRGINTGEDAGGFRDARQTLIQDFGAQMLQMQHDMVVFGTDTAAFADFNGHGPADNIAGSQIHGGRGVTRHEPLTFGIGQVPPFTAGAFGNQAAGAVNAGRVELHEFHVLVRQAGTGDHADAVTGTGMR